MEKLKIFVSYARADQPCLQACLDTIDSIPGLKAMVDVRSINPGDNWKTGIHKMVDDSHGAVLLLTKAALKSAVVLYEAALIDKAHQLNPHRYRVIPILVQSRTRVLDRFAWKTFGFKHIQNIKVNDSEGIRDGRLAQSLIKWLDEGRERIRRQRNVYLDQLPNVADAGLFGRKSVLDSLTRAWFDKRVKIVTLEATGGIGKSAIVKKWLAATQNDSDDPYFGAERVYGWSFYSQGTNDNRISADTFFKHALDFFGDRKASSGDSAAWGSRLLELIRKHRTLLILDGMEPLQYSKETSVGSIKDARLKTLVKGLAEDCGGGLCVITSRERPTDLDNRGGVLRINLPPLDKFAARELLRSAGISEDASNAELDEIAERYGRHSLALLLYGRFVRQFHNGEPRRLPFPMGRGKRPGKLAFDGDSNADLGSAAQLMSHAKKVMKSYEKMFVVRGMKQANELLYIMGLFDRPAEAGAIQALRSTSIPGLTDSLKELGSDDWIELKRLLRDNGLLLAENTFSMGDLDAHPLVREYFGDSLRKQKKSAWLNGHRCLCSYLAANTEQHPDEATSMARVYSAVNHGCSAADYCHSFDSLLRRRAWRLDDKDERQWWYATRRLGMAGDDLVALSQFYTKKFSELDPSLGLGNEIEILSNTGVRMRSLGRLEESEAFECFSGAYERSLKLLRSRNRSPRTNDLIFEGAYASCQLSELRLIQGKFREALKSAEQAQWLADVCHKRGHKRHPYIRMHALSSLADVHFQKGETAKAEEAFERARLIDALEAPRPPFMHSQSCYRYGMLLIETGRFDQLLTLIRGDHEWGVDRDNKSLLAIAIERLVHGWALLERAKAQNRPQFKQTIDILDKAIEGLIASGYSDYASRGYVIRAQFLRARNEGKDLERAAADLQEAEREARKIMALLKVDVLIERAHVAVARRQRTAAARLIREANEAVACMRYGRAAAKLTALETQFRAH